MKVLSRYRKTVDWATSSELNLLVAMIGLVYMMAMTNRLISVALG